MLSQEKSGDLALPCSAQCVVCSWFLVPLLCIYTYIHVCVYFVFSRINLFFRLSDSFSYLILAAELFYLGSQCVE